MLDIGLPFDLVRGLHIQKGLLHICFEMLYFASELCDVPCSEEPAADVLQSPRGSLGHEVLDVDLVLETHHCP